LAEGQKAFLDLLISTLMEHEKKLDAIAAELERIVNNPLLIALAESKEPEKEEPDMEFKVKLDEFMSKIPEGLNYEISRIKHSAYIKVTYDEGDANEDP